MLRPPTARHEWDHHVQHAPRREHHNGARPASRRSGADRNRHQHRAGERVWPGPDHLERHDDDRRAAASAAGLVSGDEDRPGDRDHARRPAKRQVSVHDHDQVRRAASNELDRHELRGQDADRSYRRQLCEHGQHEPQELRVRKRADAAGRRAWGAHTPLRHLDRSDEDGELPGGLWALRHPSRRPDERVRACERRQRELHD